MGKFQIVVNPTAGRGNGARIIPELLAQLRRHGVGFTLARTAGPQHATALTLAAVREGAEAVVAVGGDGTANEVVNGLMRARQDGYGDGVAMGVIPAGRGNDFAYGVRMPARLAACIPILAAGHRRRIDVGHVAGGLFPDGRFFGNSVGIGFDAVVSIEAARLTRLTGFVSYLVAVLRTLFLYHRGPHVQIDYDGQQMALPALMVSIMNGRRQGGAFHMSPRARNDDGLLDLCIAAQVSRARILTLVPHFLRGSQFGQPEIQYGQARRLVVTALEGTLPAHVDGETLSVDDRELVVALLPGQLDVICPLAAVE